MSRIKWTPEEERHVIDSYPAKSVQQIATDLNRGLNSVAGRIGMLKRRGKIARRITTTPTVEEIYGASNVAFIRDNYVRYGSRYCMDKIGVSLKCVRNVAAFLGLKFTRNSGESYEAYDINEQIFVTPTKEFAYFLGLFWADGCMGPSGACVSVACVREDLVQLLSVFESFAHWARKDKNQDSNGGDDIVRQPQLYINHCSKQLRRFLAEHQYEVKQMISPTSILQWLPDNLRHYWWRGYFDGDGSVSFAMKGIHKKTSSFTLTSCYEQDWTFAQDLFKQLGLDKCPIYRQIHNPLLDHRHSCVSLTRTEEILKVLDYIYQDYDYIGLSRKHMIYLDIKRYMAFRQQHPYLYIYKTQSEKRASMPKKPTRTHQ